MGDAVDSFLMRGCTVKLFSSGNAPDKRYPMAAATFPSQGLAFRPFTLLEVSGVSIHNLSAVVLG
jgi:hypothetical protein